MSDTPLTEFEMVDSCVKVLIKLMCLNTNATKAEYTIHGLTEKDKNHGTWKLTIKKQADAKVTTTASPDPDTTLEVEKNVTDRDERSSDD